MNINATQPDRIVRQHFFAEIMVAQHEAADAAVVVHHEPHQEQQREHGSPEQQNAASTRRLAPKRSFTPSWVAMTDPIRAPV
jgi:hypothetical protein